MNGWGDDDPANELDCGVVLLILLSGALATAAMVAATIWSVIT